ncbi:MAG: hypothetical protein GY720_03145 [bacterium]|nr:hypothetical protein [bacterium]
MIPLIRCPDLPSESGTTRVLLNAGVVIAVLWSGELVGDRLSGLVVASLSFVGVDLGEGFYVVADSCGYGW